MMYKIVFDKRIEETVAYKKVSSILTFEMLVRDTDLVKALQDIKALDYTVRKVYIPGLENVYGDDTEE